MAPRGRKAKEGIARQMQLWDGNKGLLLMLLMGYTIGQGLGRALSGVKWQENSGYIARKFWLHSLKSLAK